MDAPKSILNDQHLAQIRAQLNTIAYAKQEIAKAKLAGIDVSGPEQQLLAAEAKLQQIKSVYFPGQ